MFLAFFALLMLCGGVGVLCWLVLKRVTEHMADNPEAADLVARHVIAPLLTGKKEKKEVPNARVDVNGVVPARSESDQSVD